MDDPGGFGTSLARRLREALAAPLPGWDFQRLMLPATRVSKAEPREIAASAVLVALAGEAHSLLLIERSPGGPHGGQIAFPGGRREEGDASLVDTALREAREEIGLDPGAVEVLGLLSPLTIAVSAFLVQPVLGLAASMPKLLPNPAEVRSIIEAPIAELLDPRSKAERELIVRGERLYVPCYLFGGALVWGATAMILSELEELLRRLGP
jgi:8-oxo-dGTP pyrophosphatase MutT (NUDIX family)